MDALRLATIAHRTLPFCAPINDQDLLAILSKMRLDPDAFVLDLGCGKGEFLIRLCEHFPLVRAHGVDWNADFLSEAAENAQRRLGAAPHVTFERADVTKTTVHAGSLNALVCIGAIWLFGEFAHALRNFHTMLRPGGYALVGEAFWKRRPGGTYANNFFEAKDAELNDNAGYLQAASACGFKPLAVAVSSDHDWDEYERAWGEALVEYIARHPRDPEVQQIVRRAHKGRDNLLVHGGRDILGFALYLLQKR